MNSKPRNRHLALGIIWVSAALLLLAACSPARLSGPWPVPSRPALEADPRPFPRVPGIVGCLSGAGVSVEAAQECPPGSRAVAVMDLEGMAQVPVWERDVRDAWSRMKARLEDYFRRVEALLESINRASK